MADIITDNAPIPQPERPKKWFDHLAFGWIFLTFAAVMFVVGVGFSDASFATFATLVAKKSLTLIVILLFTKYWKTTNYDADAKIYREPIAIAIYLGSIAIALGFSS